MPHDKNGTVLKPGDRVVIPATVKEVNSVDDYCNVNLETEEPMHPSPTKTLITLNTRQVIAQVAAMILAALVLLIGMPAQAQTQPDTNNPPTVTSSLTDLWTAVKLDHTNWIWEVHGLYAPALQSKYGGGIGAFHPITQYMFAGVRADYVDGGFWMPSGSAGLQLPVSPFSWLHLTPFTYAGIGIPLSGAKVGDFSVPGHVRDNNGQATAILGYGLAVKVFTSKSGRWSFDLIADRENWSGFSGQQYRGGFLIHKTY